MQDKLGEFGVDLPDFETIQAEREAVRAEATAQREAVRTLVDGLRAEGATREEIRDALAEAGYDKAGPRGGGRGHRGHHGPRGGPPADTAPENGE
jgi:hypothetical protein